MIDSTFVWIFIWYNLKFHCLPPPLIRKYGEILYNPCKKMLDYSVLGKYTYSLGNIKKPFFRSRYSLKKGQQIDLAVYGVVNVKLTKNVVPSSLVLILITALCLFAI